MRRKRRSKTNPATAEVERLRKEHESGDPLALNSAFLFCIREHLVLRRWIIDALASRLSIEMNIRQEKATDYDHLALARWDTFVWFHHRLGHSRKVASELAARAFGNKGGGASTILHAYNYIQKKMHLIGHKPPVLRGAEDMSPADLRYGPPEDSL